MERLYFDNAATSWPKPEGVYRAVDQALRELGCGAGRGSTAEALEVERRLLGLRRGLAALIGAPEPTSIVFANSGTDALHLAFEGVLGPGDHVVTTVVEHNSVLRPLRHAERDRGVRVSVVAAQPDGVIDPDRLAQALRPTTRLVVLNHASNVTGAVQPVADVGRIVRQHGALLLVDAAQTVGHWPVDVGEAAIDLLAAPGHKGLVGPLGTGFLYVGPRAAPHIRAVRPGGTGQQSDSPWQPDELPTRLEAGNLNVPGLLGLAAGLAWLGEHTGPRQREVTANRIAGVRQRLADLPNVRLQPTPEASLGLGIVSFRFEGLDPHEAATALETAFRVQLRAGLHCAPLMHEHLGTAAHGGSLRLSLGSCSTEEHLDQALEAIAQFAHAMFASSGPH